LTVDTIDKARRVAIFFDNYKLDKEHILDSSSSLCLQIDKKKEKEHKEFPPLQRIKAFNPPNADEADNEVRETDIAL